jgi:hypothetical protein
MNKLFLLPLVLGLIGLVYQLSRDVRNWSVVMLLFFFTGMAIVIYLNQYPYQPRERDYAYVGSFYAFAIWIGLGVYAMFDAASGITRKELLYGRGRHPGLGVLKYLVEMASGGDHTVSYSLFVHRPLAGAALGPFTCWAACAMTGRGRGHPAGPGRAGGDGGAPNGTTTTAARRFPARDLASDYLESCAPMPSSSPTATTTPSPCGTPKKWKASVRTCAW